MNTASISSYSYVKYLTTHISRVQKVVQRLIEDQDFKAKILSYNPRIDYVKFIASLTSRASLHDNSKWQIEEFLPYLNYFHPEGGEVTAEVQKAFDKASEHHYLLNDHHTDYWRLRGRIQSMPLTAICEMLADWVSMSLFVENSPIDWYKEHKEVLEGMTPRQIEITEDLLYNVFNPIYLEFQASQDNVKNFEIK